MESDEESPTMPPDKPLEEPHIKSALRKPHENRVCMKLNVRVISPGFEKEQDFDVPQKVYREHSSLTVKINNNNNNRWRSSEKSTRQKSDPVSKPKPKLTRRHTVSGTKNFKQNPPEPETEDNINEEEANHKVKNNVEKTKQEISFVKPIKRNSVPANLFTPRTSERAKLTRIQAERSNTLPELFEDVDFKKFHEENLARKQLSLKQRSHTLPFETQPKAGNNSLWKTLDKYPLLVQGKDHYIKDILPTSATDDLKASLSEARKKSLTTSGLWQLATASVYEFKASKSRDFGDIAMALVTKQIAVEKMRNRIEKKLDLPEGRFARIAALRQKMEAIEKKFKSLKMSAGSGNGGLRNEEEKYDEAELRPPKFCKPGEAMQFFRKCSRVIMIVLKWIDLIMDDKNRLEKELKSFVDIANEVEESTVSQAMLDSGLSFDKNVFKAKREITLTAEHRKILTTRWNFRTPEMVQQVMHGLQALRSLSEYPLHTQEKLCKVAWYQTIGPKKAIIRQGHKAESFYFILSGVAFVKKLLQDEKTGETRVHTIARLTKGMSFGEIGLIFNTLRSATVESATAMELLVIGKEDFNRIFMKAENPDEEAEHIQFLRQVPMMQTWPVDKLLNEPGACLLHFFKRGTLITEDGKNSEWLYFIKSGSCEVLKKLKATKAKKAGQVQRKLDPMCDVILPELGNPQSPRVDTGQHKRRQEFVMSPEVFDDMSKYYDKLKKKILGEKAKEKARLEAPTPDPERIKISLPRLVGPNATGHLVTLCEEEEDESGSSRIPSGLSSVKTINLSLPPHLSQKDEDSPGVSKSPIEKYTNSTLGKLKAHFMFPSTDKIRSLKPSPRDSPETEEILTSRRGNVFVMIELLHPRDSFGINTLTGWGSDDIDDMLNDSPPTALVSNGAEVVMLSKKVFMKYINDDVRCMLRENVRAYPKETVMQDNLQRKLDWEEYKSTVISDWFTTKTILKEINSPV